MNFADALDWLYATQFHGIKLGLEQVQRLFDFLKIDSTRPHFLHVAGTNGKGSVCAMLDAICREGGLKTGLFTSPHLIHFNERIRINGLAMPETEIAEKLTEIREKVSSWESHPTFFEITTALALDYFQHAETDVVVLETGLGGRLDATNIVQPAVSILTAIDFDHESWLGNSLSQIAFEKAGIIKQSVPVVSIHQHPECENVIQSRADEVDAPCHWVRQPWGRSSVNLAGSHQRQNAALAVEALARSGISVSPGAIKRGLAKVVWPGRFQPLSDGLIIDGAHNPAAAQRLAATWREQFQEERATVIFAAMRDKAAAEILKALAPVADAFIFAPLQNPRAAEPSELAELLREVAPHISFTTVESLPAALSLARNVPSRILITGSLFLAGEALAILQGSQQPRSSAQ